MFGVKCSIRYNDTYNHSLRITISSMPVKSDRSLWAEFGGKPSCENKKPLSLLLCWEVNSKYCSLFLRSENWNPNPVSKFKVKPLFKKWNFTKKSKQGSSNFCNVLKISARFVKFLQCSFSGQFDDHSFWQIMSKICNRIISSSVSEL